MSLARLASLVRERGDLVSRILLATAQLAAIAWFSPGPGLPLDDAWIHQVVARTFAETGTLGYAPGQHGAAATSYLWAALLAIDFKLLHVDPSRWALFLNTLSALVAGQLLHSLLVRAKPADVEPSEWRVTSFVTTLLACISPNILWFVCSGMEAMPSVALSLGAIWAATDESSGTHATIPRRAILSGVLAGALALLRPEAAPLGGILAVHALVRGRRRSFLPIAVPWIAAVGVYVASNLAKTGHPLPSTLSGRRWLWFEMSAGLSRTDRALDFLDAWATRLGSYTLDTSLAVVWILVAIAAFGALRITRPWRRPHPASDGTKLLFAWALFHAAFYALLLPTPGHGGRYQPLTPLLFATCLPLGTAFVVRDLARVFGAPERARFVWFAVCGIAPWIALAAPVAGSLRDANALAVAHIQATELGAGAFIDHLPEGAVASFDIGGSGYAARRRVLDLGGLSDPSTASLLEAGRISTWLEANQVRWIVLPQSYEPVLPVFEDYRVRLHLRENAALRLEPVRVFETPFDRWVPSIRATWNAAPKQVVYEVHYTSRPGPLDVPLPPADARRDISDPGSLVPRRERVVAEHMLATLAAWGLPVDVRVTSMRPSESVPASGSASATTSAVRWGASPKFDLASGDTIGATPKSGPCIVSMGRWGFSVDGCSAAGDAALIRAIAYEQAGRYIDAGDLGGALRAIPHVIAQVKRRVDPRFHPPIAPLMPPTPGGVHVSPMRAGRFGLALFVAVLIGTLGIETAARRNARVSRLVAKLRARLPAIPATVLVLATAAALFVSGPIGCGRRNTDVAGAVARGRGAVEIAIASGGSVDEEEGSQRVPLLEAAAAGDAEVVSLLLSRGAHLDVHARDGAGPLHLAARRGHHAAVTVLAAAMTADGHCGECGRDRKDSFSKLDATAGHRSRTAVHDAVLAGSVETVSTLLAAGADPNKVDSFAQSGLHLVGSIEPSRSPAIASTLLSAGADPLLADARGFTALHAAAVADNVPLIRFLASARPHLLEVKTPAGETALDLALRYGQDGAAEMLLRSGSILARDDAWPPLHEAARVDAVERAANLLAGGADTFRRFRNKTALDVAIAHGSKRVEALLRERTR